LFFSDCRGEWILATPMRRIASRLPEDSSGYGTGSSTDSDRAASILVKSGSSGWKRKRLRIAVDLI
jgi:hypothetical protein